MYCQKWLLMGDKGEQTTLRTPREGMAQLRGKHRHGGLNGYSWRSSLMFDVQVKNTACSIQASGPY